MKLESKKLRSIRVWDKLAMVLIALAIPVVVLSYLVTLQGRERVDTAKTQLHGIDYLRPIHSLMRELADYRDLNYLFLSGDRGRAQEVGAKRGLVDAAVAEVDNAHQAYGQDFDPEGVWEDIKAKWNALKADDNRQSSFDNLKAVDALMRQIVDHHARVAGTSKLLLDPEAESYYLVDIWAKQIPDTIDVAGRVRTAAYRATRGQDAYTLLGSIAVLREQLRKVGEAIGFAVETTPALQERLDADLKALQSSSRRLAATAQRIRSQPQSDEVRKLMTGNVGADAGKAISAAVAILDTVEPGLREILNVRMADSRTHMMRFVGGGITLALLAIFLGYVVMQTVTRPLAHLAAVAKKVASGDRKARARLKTQDEIGELAKQFDHMLDLRDEALAQQVESAEKAARENEQLNSSVITLLQAVATLSKRDLTVKVPVAEDVTGPVADAINLMADETAKILGQVVNVAQGVAGASDEVRQKSDTAMNVALDDKIKVEQTGRELAAASKAMSEIAELALASSESASRAITTTDRAQETVQGTVQGISGIRDTIRETEKRIKRLGERSQEIGGVVSLINNIAERTHILALNASMHAASAGEAGRGFAVVANEVQRLAESAREATGQIAALVNSIQAETADTVNTMNETISKVVEGTKLAEQAGAEMGNTRQVTSELVEFVKQIDQSSKRQAEVVNKLMESAEDIRQSAELTYDTLQTQSTSTVELADYSAKLLEAVSMFTLPASVQPDADEESTGDDASADLKRAA